MVTFALFIAIAGVFVAGGIAGFILFVSVGIRKEERRFARTRKVSLTRPAPGPVSAATRSINGVYVREFGDTVPLAPRAEAATGASPYAGHTLN